MRQLHPVSFHERFVASGTYIHCRDNVATGDVEHWTLHEPGQGAWTLRADYDGRDGSGINWLFEGYYDRVRRRVERFDLSLYGAQQADVKFGFEPHEVRVTVRSAGERRDGFAMALPPGYAALPPALVAAYLFVRADAAELPLFVPALDFVRGRVHHAAVETGTVEFAGSEDVTVDGRTLPARVVRVRGDRGRDVTCWLDTNDILLRWQTADGLSALLTQYVHRPETTS